MPRDSDPREYRTPTDTEPCVICEQSAHGMRCELERLMRADPRHIVPLREDLQATFNLFASLLCRTPYTFPGARA